VTIDEFRNKVLPAEIPLANPKKSKPGKLMLEQFQLVTVPTFMDFLRGGLQLNLIVAIDFTGSNGIPSSPSSLHYLNPTKPNEYQLALNGIWQILENYDSDKRIPAFGFGAKPRFPGFTQSTVSHCFPLSGRPGDP
jgi:hypothetical protein